jgi:hypothetical protein
MIYVIFSKFAEACSERAGYLTISLQELQRSVFEAQTMMNKTSSKSRRSLRLMCLRLMCGIVALCCGLDISRESLASEPVRIFNVAVYFDREPPCATAAVNSITVTVSPFKEQVYLGDLIAELARKAAETGAKVVYAIKLISFVPNQGAVATATVSTCLQPNPPPFGPELLALVKGAPEVRAYVFADRDSGAPRSVQTSTLLPRNFGDTDATAQLRRLIFSDDTYDSTPGVELGKSCPFIPSFGFEFREGANSTWWLVSEMCKTATLVSRTKYWPEAEILNLRPEAVAAFRQLLETPRN